MSDIKDMSFTTFNLPPSNLPPFTCTTFLYQVVAEVDANSEFRMINTVTGEVTIINPDMGFGINAIGFNPLDNYIYGNRIVLDGAGDPLQRNLVRIGSDGNVEDLGILPNVTDISGINVGAIDDQGYYYFKRSARDYYWTMDLIPGSPTCGQLVDPTNGYTATTSSVQVSPAGQLTNGDWTYNKSDGLLYATDEFTLQFLTLDPTTGQMNQVPTQGGFTLEYGAMGSDSNGFIYGIDNNTGDVVRWINNGGTMEGELFSQTLGTIRNDATMCINAVIELDFGDAPDITNGTGTGDYRTRLANDGPRHQIINELFIGSAVTPEDNALHNSTATGDSDDGLTAPVQITTGSTSVTIPITVTNNTGSIANLYAWIDANNDGIFQTNEGISTTVNSQAGAQNINLNFTNIPGGVTSDTFMRVRLTTASLNNTGGASSEDTRSYGPAVDGEVEDYQVIVTTVSEADVTVTKNADLNSVVAGDTLTYTIVVSNIGQADADSVTLTDAVPLDNVEFSQDNGATWNPWTGNTNLGTIVVNGSETVLIRGTVPAGATGTIDNTATVSTTTPESNTNNNQDSESTPVTVVSEADITVTKNADLNSVVAGDTLTYTIVVSNIGQADADSVTLTDAVPLDSPEFSVDNGATWNPWTGNTNLGTIVVNGSETVLIRGIVPAGATGTINNTATVSTTTPESNTNNNQDSESTPVTNEADISIVKTASPEPVVAGEILTYTLVINNAGPSPASSVTLTDAIPLTGPEFSTNNGATWSAWTGSTNIGTLEVGDTVTVLIRGGIDSDAAGTIDNIATVSTTTNETNLTNNTDNVSTTIISQADLSIVKSGNPNPVIAGELLNYTLVINNAGPSDAENVEIIDTVPLDNPEYSLNGGATWLAWAGSINIGGLENGASATILIRGIVPTGTIGSIINIADVTSTTLDPNLANNTDDVTVVVNTEADVSIIKTANLNEVVAGEVLTYNLLVSNAGPSDAQNVTVVDNIPLNSGEYSLDGGITWFAWTGNVNLGAFTVNESRNVLIRGEVPSNASGVIDNIADVTSTTPDPNITNNTDNVQTDIITQADVAIIKTADLDPVIAGEILTYTLEVTNFGPSDAQNVEFIDTVPLNDPEFSTDNGVSWLPWLGTLNIGILANGDSRSILIRGQVSQDATGSIDNEAEVTSTTPDPNPQNNTDDVRVQVEALVDISIVKTANLNPVIAGEILTYTLEINNQGPSDAQDVTVVDSVSLNTPEFSLNNGLSWIPWIGTVNLGGLVVGETREVLIRGEVPEDATGTINNVAQVTSLTPDLDLTNNIDDVIVDIITQADISVVKMANPDPVVAGEILTYNMIVTNNGPSTALDVELIDIVPLNNPEYSLDGGTTWFTWTGSVVLGTFEVGDSKEILIRGEVPSDASGIIENTAQVTSTTPDTDLSNNTDDVQTDIIAQADVAIMKAANPDPVIAGEVLTYILEATNLGPSDAQNVELIDTVPLNAPEYSMDNGVSWIPWLGSLNIGTLVNGASRSILIRGQVPEDTTGIIDNQAEVTSTTPDPNLTNNTDDVIVDVQTLADVSIVKNGSPNPVIAGELLTYTLEVSNAGPSVAQNVEVIDTPTLETPEFSINNGLTWVPWSGSLNLGTLAVNETRVLLIRGIVPDDVLGSIYNNAEVTSTTQDSDITNNMDDVIINVQTLADISIIKTASPEPAVAGESLIYTLEISNAGPSVAQSVELIDAVPLNDPEYSVDNGTTWFTWLGSLNLGALNVNDTKVVLIRGNLPSDASGIVENIAQVTTPTTEINLTNNIDDVSTIINTEADLMIVKTANPDPVIAGEVLTYRLDATNNGPSDAQNVKIIDEVPLDNSEVSIDNGITWVPWTGQISMGTLGEGESISILIRGDVKETAIGSIDNIAEVTSTTPDPNPQNNIDNITTQVEVLADLSIIKTASPEPVIAGEILTYELEVSNIGPSVAHSVEILDIVPLNNPEFSLNNGISWLPWVGSIDLGTFAVGQIEEILIRGQVPEDTIGNIDNIAEVTSITPDPNLSNNEDDVTVVVDTEADVSIIKTASPEAVIAGEVLTYTLEINNAGPSDAQGVELIDAVPLENPEFSLNNGASWAQWLGSINLGTFIVNETRIVLIRGIVPTDTVIEIENMAEVTSITNDIDLSNNTDNVITTVIAEADLAIIKLADPEPVVAGETLIYTLVATNFGPSDAQNVVITDNVPVDIPEYSLDGGISWIPWSGNLSVGTLIVGQVAEVLIRGMVSSDKTGVLENTASITSTTPDPDISNNEDSIITDINTVADIGVVKTSSPDPVIAGEALTYSLVVTNYGPSDAQDVNLVDVVPLENPEYSINTGITWLPWIGAINFGALTMGDSREILVRGIVANDTLTSINNTVKVTTTTTDPNPDNDEDTIITEVDTLADVQIIKTVDKDKVTIGDLVTYRLDVKNNGPSKSLGVTISDTIDSGLLFPEYTADNGLNWATWSSVLNIGDLEVEESKTIFIRATVANNTLGIVQNTAVVESLTDDQDLSNNISSADIEVLYADLVSEGNFIKLVDKLYSDINEEVTYTIKATNTGNTNANNVVITDPVPNGTSYVFGSLRIDGQANVSNPENGINLSLPIVPNQTVVIEFKVLVNEIPDPNPIPNKAFVDYTYTVDPQNPNSESVSTETNLVETLVSHADLVSIGNFIKAVDKEYADVGDEITYTITAINTGNVDATNVVITDPIPNGTSFVVNSLQVNNALVNENPENGIDIGIVSPNQVVEIEFKVLVEEIPDPNPIPNKAFVDYTYTVDPSIPDGVSVSSETNEVQTQVNRAEILVENAVKSANRDITVVDDVFTYEIKLTNTGNVEAMNVVVDDTVPVGVEFVTGSAKIDGNSTMDSPLTGINVGGILPNQIVVITFDVKVLDGAPDKLVNTATIDYDYIVDPDEPPKMIEVETNEVVVDVLTPELTLEKSANRVGAVIGDIIEYELKATNTGEIELFDVIIKDELKDIVKQIGDVTVNGVVITNGDIKAGVNIGILEIDEVKIVRFDVEVLNTTDINILTNQITSDFNYKVEGNIFEGEIQSNLVDVELFNPSIDITKKSDESIIKVGDIFNYDITVKNTGDIALTDVELVDILPDSMKIVEVLIDNTPINGGLDGVIIIDMLAVGEEKMITLVVEAVDSQRDFENIVTVTGNAITDPNFPPTVVEDEARDDNLVDIYNPELTIVKSVDKEYAIVDDELKYTLTVTNTGDIVLGTEINPVVIYDDLDSAVEFIDDSIKVNGVLRQDLILFEGIDIGILGIGDTVTIEFMAKVITDIYETAQNIAQASFGYILPDTNAEFAGNATSNEVIVNIVIAELNMQKVADKEKAILNDEITYTVTITNDGDTLAKDIIFKDTLDKNVKFIPRSFTVNGKAVNVKRLERGINVGDLAENETLVITYKVKVINTGCNFKIENIASIKFKYILPDRRIIIKEFDDIQAVKSIDGTISTFTQFSIEEELCIPTPEPDVECINEVRGSIEIFECHLVNTMDGLSQENQNLTGYKISVSGCLKLNANYTALDTEQSVHSVSYNILFSKFIVLPNEYVVGSRINVTGDIEDIYYNMHTPREFFTNTTLLLNARILECK